MLRIPFRVFSSTCAARPPLSFFRVADHSAKLPILPSCLYSRCRQKGWLQAAGEAGLQPLEMQSIFFCVGSNPTYGVHTGPASVKNVALSENQLLTPTEGAP